VTTTTIGDVLNRLRDEFDDITISKIRFLEAEGLITPDRTDSGYRKFTEADVERLRYVLRAQRDRYLPLKVIREELDRLDAGLPVSDPEPEPSATTTSTAPTEAQPTLLDANLSDVVLSDRELADAAHLTDEDLAALRDHGLLGGAPHDGAALRVARIAGKLLAAGLEVRHLRMYRQFADREAALVEQRVAPALRQRNPDSRRAAVRAAEEMVALGGDLQRALLAGSLQSILRT
jgi:DNA-binding transcriptional MerR regulator